MLDTILPILNFIGAALASQLIMFFGMGAYTLWERNIVGEHETIDRLKFGLDQNDISKRVEGEMARDYYRNIWIEYGNKYFRNRVANLIGWIMKLFERLVYAAAFIYVLVLLYLAFDKDVNINVLIWIMPAALIASFLINFLAANICIFFTGRVPLEPRNASLPAKEVYDELNRERATEELQDDGNFL